ncbi:MAG TPA: hypothetical protein PKA58_07805, partial [Polyangium sp.]|nr:hypothetical protein [Polyangium sp.]
VPIFDTLFAMVRRWLERRPIFSPDRGHIHHRLLDMGLTHRRAVLIIYAINVILMLTAIAISLGRSWQVGVALVATSAVFFGLVRAVGYFGYVHRRRRQRERLRPQDSELLRRVVPKLPARFELARTLPDVMTTLSEFGLEARLCYIEIIQPDETAAPEFQWTNPNESETYGPDVLSARYPIGRDDLARVDIKFGFRSDFGEVCPQTEVLLQIVTDLVETSFTRVRSRLAPHAPVVEEAEAAPSRPATAQV